jgi:hypothetical protein
VIVRIRSTKRAAPILSTGFALAIWACSRTSSPEEAESSERPAAVEAQEASKRIEELAAACEKLSSTQDPLERHRAEEEVAALVYGLGALGAGAGEPLLRAVREDGPYLFRHHALEALAAASPRQAVGWATEAFPRSGEDVLLRVRAAEVLLSLDGERGRGTVEAALRRENEITFPPLAELVDVYAQAAGERAIPALLPFLQERWRGTSTLYQAVEALGRLRAREAAPGLRSIVLGETVDHFVRRKAVQSLVEIEGSEACPFLEKCAAEEREAGFRRFLEDTLARRCR